jgi:hypothetical protein
MEFIYAVEEDVEKKRHIKNPWSEKYISLLQSPFAPASYALAAHVEAPMVLGQQSIVQEGTRSIRSS